MFAAAALSPPKDMKMQFPEWTKPSVYGALVGATVLAIGGFSLGGWVTGGTAAQMAKAMSHKEVTMALVPVCVDMAANDPARADKLRKIDESPRYDRHTAVMNAGWATVPGTSAANRDLARACLDGLDLDKS